MKGVFIVGRREKISRLGGHFMGSDGCDWMVRIGMNRRIVEKENLIYAGRINCDIYINVGVLLPIYLGLFCL